MFRPLFLAALFLIGLAPAAQADVVNDFTGITCNPDLNYLQIDTLEVNGDLPARYAAQHPDLLWDTYRLLGPAQLFDINDVAETQRGKTFKTSCALVDASGTSVLYHLAITGHVFNRNPMGRCGLAYSIKVALSTKERPVISDLTLMPDCTQTTKIRRITISPHVGSMMIEGRRDNGQAIHEILPIEGIMNGQGQPLTNDFFTAN